MYFVIKDIVNFKYELKLEDGGMNSNAPVLFAYAEAQRLWPDSDILILSIGTGTPYSINTYNSEDESMGIHNLTSPLDDIFSAKEMTTLQPLLSM